MASQVIRLATLCLFLCSSLLVSVSAQAQKIKARRAIVSIDGAAVYAKPDFDAEVLTYLKLGEPVVASVKTFPGRGGIGLFFAVRGPNNVRGFIADTDLVAAESKKPLSPLMKKEKPVDLPTEASASEDASLSSKEPLYFTRFLGATLGRKGYSMKYDGKTYSSDLLFFGVRGTGPGTLFDGPPLDFNLAVSVDSPKFFEEFAQNKPNGFLVFSDLLLQLPLWEKQNQLIYYAFGFMASYSSYRVQVNNQFRDTKEFRLGGELGIGYAHRVFRKYLVRADYKYHFERFQNNSFWLSVMMEY